jgi:hypothetical protein
MVMVALLLATVVAPVALAYRLCRTRAWWVAGSIVACAGVYLLLPVKSPYGGAGDPFVQGIGVVLLAHAAILLLTSRSARSRARAIERPAPRV